MIKDKEATREPKLIDIHAVSSLPEQKEAMKGLDDIHEGEINNNHLKAIEIIKPLVDLLKAIKL